jgi:TPR repeat protein
MSAADIVALVGRGDAFFSARDISSARLYYERAAEAGDGQAAVQLGASFDPVMLERAGVYGVIGDPAQALSWYRRARELGVAEAEHRIKSLEAKSLGGAETLSR